MSLHTWLCQGPPRPKQLHHLHVHRGRAATSKKSPLSMHTGSLRSCSTLYDPVDFGLPGFSVSGLLQARILDCIVQYLLPYPPRAPGALYFLLS